MSFRRITSNALKQVSRHVSRYHAAPTEIEAVDCVALERAPVEQTAQNLLVRGYKLDRAGLPDAADTIYQQTIQYLEIYQAEQNHRATSETIGRIALRHGVHLFRLNRLAEAHAAFNEAVVRFDSMLANDTSIETIDNLATALRWLANTRRLIGDLPKARATYLRTIALYRQLLAFTINKPLHPVYDRLMHSAVIGLGKTIRLQRQQLRNDPPRGRSRKRATT